MTGTISIKNGYWYLVLWSYDDDGKRNYKWINTSLKTHGNKKNAKELLNIELKKYENQKNAALRMPFEDKNDEKNLKKNTDCLIPFSPYLHQYVESVKATLSPHIYRMYGVYFQKHFDEFFGKRKTKLIDVTTDTILDFYDYLRKKGLKNTSIKHLACVIRPALRKACKDRLIFENPYLYVPPIKKEKPSIQFYDKNEMAKFLEVINGHKYELAFKMLAYYGLRRSELLGLRWKVIDFEHKTISINHKLLVTDEVIFSDTLKTTSSNRMLPLMDSIAKDLKNHKKKIEANKKFFKKQYDNRYLDYIFVEENGKIIYPDRISRWFIKILRKNKLKHIRLHDLRHSCASIMLANGVQLKQIQEWLGHSNFATTADVYSHLDFSSKIASATVIENAYENKPKKNTDEKENVKISLLKEAMDDMKKLGIHNMDDYFDYLENQDGSEDRNAKDSEMEME